MVGVAAATSEVAQAVVVISGSAGAIGGGLVGYNKTGSAQGAALGAVAGASIGFAAATANPVLATSVASTVGGGWAGAAVGTGTFVLANGAAGGIAVSDATLINGQTPTSFDIVAGAAVGAASTILEAPFAATGGAGAFDAALGANSGIFSATGSIATTCSTSGGGCGPKK